MVLYCITKWFVFRRQRYRPRRVQLSDHPFIYSIKWPYLLNESYPRIQMSSYYPVPTHKTLRFISNPTQNEECTGDFSYLSFNSLKWGFLVPLVPTPSRSLLLDLTIKCSVWKVYLILRPMTTHLLPTVFCPYFY